MGKGPMGGPRPFAKVDLVMEVTISTGSLDRIKIGKRDVDDHEVEDIEKNLRRKIIKSAGTGPADSKIEVENIPARRKIKIYLGDKVNKQQVRDIQNIMEGIGYYVDNYTIEGE